MLGDEIGMFISKYVKEIRLSNSSFEIEAIRKELSHLSKLDIGSLLDRLDQLESRGVSSESLLTNLRARLVDVQKNLQSVVDWKDSTKKRVHGIEDSLKSVTTSLSELEHQAKKTGEYLEVHSEKLAKFTNPEEIIKQAISRIEKILPERLLVKLSPKGDVIVDPKLFAYLQTRLVTSSDTSQLDKSKAYEAINIEEIKSFVDGKLGDLEQKLVSRDDVLRIVKEQIDSIVPELMERNPAKLEPLDVNEITESVLVTVLEKLKDNYPTPVANGTIEKVLPEPVIEKVNWASDKSGARPIIGLSSKTYHPTPVHWFQHIKLLGTQQKLPHVVLSDDNSLGNCWPIQGDHGSLVVQLAKDVRPESFGICHLSSRYQIDRTSAPATVQVWAIPDMTKPSPEDSILAARFKYDLAGPDCQTFPVQAVDLPASRLYRVEILDNHGKSDYTCIYQFLLY